MFTEPHFEGLSAQKNAAGWIEVICGSMFSGKTQELLRRLQRAEIARKTTVVFKPLLDTRYSTEKVVSHDRNSVAAIAVTSSSEILQHTAGSQVVGIDEAQFFDPGLIEVCSRLADAGKRVIVSGLDMDYMGKPFGLMPELMSIAEYVTKARAVCARCGEAATYSHRIAKNDSQILLGEKDAYEPRCRGCFNDGIGKNGTEELAVKVKQ